MTDDEPGIPAGGISRAARMAGLPAGHLARAAIGLGRRLGGRPAELIAAEAQRRTAEQIFATLGELKGGAMKVGQALSAMEAALPVELSGPYREALVRLQEAAPPLPTSMVHRALAECMGSRWKDRFREFEDEPAAAASIGQVHHATWNDGREVAVKVQYPGAAQALLSDFGHLERLTPLVRLGAPGIDARAMFRELHDRLVEEVDYVSEAAAQQTFAEAFGDDPDVLVPRVVEVHPRVLVTEWVAGTPLSQVIDRGSEADRDRAGLLLVRFHASSPPRAGLLHGDPHPGNFRVLADGRLGVLDFGSCEPMPGGWPPALGELLRAGADRDADELHALAARSGLIDGSKVTARSFLDFLNPMLDPLRSERFTFDRPWLQRYARQASDPRSPHARMQRRLRVPAKHMLVQRVAVGTVAVLCSLGATVAVRAEGERWLPGLHSTG